MIKRMELESIPKKTIAMFTAIVETETRSQKRKVLAEINRNKKRFIAIESHFDELLQSGLDYVSAYNTCLERWNFEIEYLFKTNKFRYTLPNKKYFVQNYKVIDEAAN